jgi:hypothetical protein
MREIVAGHRSRRRASAEAVKKLDIYLCGDCQPTEFSRRTNRCDCNSKFLGLVLGAFAGALLLLGKHALLQILSPNFLPVSPSLEKFFLQFA